MEAKITHLGEAQFEIQIRNHTLICDQPEADGGYNEGPTPPEFLLASLGSCAAYYAAEYLRTRKLPADGLTVKVIAGKAKNPSRLDQFKIEIDLTEPLLQQMGDRHRDGILRAANACLIHNTLTHPPEISITLVGAPEKADCAA